MAGSPSVEARVVGRGVVALVSGEMNYMTGPGLWEQINDALAGDIGFVVLDLSEVTFCDSAGLNVLLRASRRAALSDVQLVLACVQQPLLRILEMTGAPIRSCRFVTPSRRPKQRWASEGVHLEASLEAHRPSSGGGSH